jgi:hypothetical protein
MTPIERLGAILDKLNITTMPRYWANIIALELAAHHITLEEKNDRPANSYGQGDLLPQRDMPPSGGLLSPGPPTSLSGEDQGKRPGSARIEYRGAVWDPDAPM